VSESICIWPAPTKPIISGAPVDPVTIVNWGEVENVFIVAEPFFAKAAVPRLVVAASVEGSIELPFGNWIDAGSKTVFAMGGALALLVLAGGLDNPIGRFGAGVSVDDPPLHALHANVATQSAAMTRILMRSDDNGKMSPFTNAAVRLP